MQDYVHDMYNFTQGVNKVMTHFNHVMKLQNREVLKSQNTQITMHQNYETLNHETLE